MNAVAANTSSLYVLVFPSRGLLKIGKANNVHTRCEKLRQAWGDADYAQSFELVAPQSTVFRLEKSLHFMLSAHSANATNADGYTEMFSLDALDIAVMHIELFVASSQTPIALKKGIAAPHTAAKERKQAAISQDLSGLGVGAIGHIGVMAWAVFCIVKAEAVDGECSARPSTQRIADLVGVSHDTVHRALATLTSASMLRVTKARGARNLYAWA